MVFSFCGEFGFLKFIFGFEIDVCISFVAHLIHLLKQNISAIIAQP